MPESPHYRWGFEPLMYVLYLSNRLAASLLPSSAMWQTALLTWLSSSCSQSSYRSFHSRYPEYAEEFALPRQLVVPTA